MGTQIIGFHGKLSASPGITLETISKKPFGPIRRRRINLSVGRLSQLLEITGALLRVEIRGRRTLNQNPFFR